MCAARIQLFTSKNLPVNILLAVSGSGHLMRSKTSTNLIKHHCNYKITAIICNHLYVQQTYFKAYCFNKLRSDTTQMNTLTD